MTRLWLPTGAKPFPDNTEDERQVLINRLWELRYSVPGAKKMELSQLRDYVAYAEEKFKIQEEKDRIAAEKKLAKMNPEQVRGALKEYLNWKARKEGRAKPYHAN